MAKYTDDYALNELKKWFEKLGHIPTKNEFKIYGIKPTTDYYIDNFGGVINACVILGLIEKPLTKEERMEISIKELREISTNLERIPFGNEYDKLRNKGYSMYPLQKNFNMSYTQICDRYLYDLKEIITEGYKKCSICKKIKPLNDFGEWNKSKLGVRSSCKICDYIKRNGISVPNNWTKEECLIVLDLILNEKIKYVNELSTFILNKTLEDFINLLNNYLKIGNKPLNIKVYCMFCGKEEFKPMSVYIKNKIYFCSHECYWNYKKEFEPKGEEHPSYNRITTLCTNCGKEIKVIPSDYNKNNIYGDNHNFCSQDCYWEFRSKYYIGNKSTAFGRKLSKKEINNLRIRNIQYLKNNQYKLNSKPQVEITNLLNSLNIKNTREYDCKYYAIDNYLDDYNLMIEVMGDYFHANPLVFNKLNDMQLKDIKRDKSKRTYIKRYKNINILYLWELDIKKRPDVIKYLILEYIEHEGVLDEYNSFNYFLINNKLIINSNIITPYIDVPSEELNRLKKIS